MRRGEGAGETDDGGERKPDACAMRTDSNRVERLAMLMMIQFEVKYSVGFIWSIFGATALRVELGVNSHCN